MFLTLCFYYVDQPRLYLEAVRCIGFAIAVRAKGQACHGHFITGTQA